MYDTVIGGEELIERGAELIRKGEVVAFPTETVYGLGGNALDKTAINKIYEAKNRPKDNPFIVHVTDLENADKAAEVTDEAAALFSHFAPGPLTIVLKKRDCIPYEATAGLDTVGIRMPSHPLCRRFLARCGVPVAAPSANASKRISPTRASYVYDDMKGRIPMIIDGGECDVGIESTVITLATEIPTILRPGIITAERLAQYLPAVRTHKGEVLVAPAPGMKYKHYAPIVPCYLFDDPNKAVEFYRKGLNRGMRTAIIARTGTQNLFGEVPILQVGIDGVEIAHNIFDYLRICEKDYDAILIQRFSDSGEEGAVMNRIYKSCEGKFL